MNPLHLVAFLTAVVYSHPTWRGDLTEFELLTVCRTLIPMGEKSSCLIHHTDVFTDGECVNIIPWVSPMQTQYSHECLLRCSNGSYVRPYDFVGRMRHNYNRQPHDYPPRDRDRMLSSGG